MLWSNYALGRDPTLWPEPHKFKPERWLEGENEPTLDGSLWKPTAQVSDFKYPVFNAGPRLCLGRPLAYLEVAMMLATLFERYDLQEAQQHTEAYTNALVCPMKDGLHVTVKRR